MELPDRREVADHEASHAVVYWWWVHRPNGVDDGTGGEVFEVSIEPDREARTAGHTLVDPHFQPPPLPPRQRRKLEHWCVHMLAGPCSDRVRGGDAGGAMDERAVRELLHFYYPETHDDMYRKFEADAQDLLNQPAVNAMVAALATELVDRGRLSGEEAIRIVRQAISELRSRGEFPGR